MMDFLSDIFGATSGCGVRDCDGKVRAEKSSELIQAAIGFPAIDDTGRPWIADAPGSRTGYLVCNQHDYNGEYLG
jgi:hypothetical protein